MDMPKRQLKEAFLPAPNAGMRLSQVNPDEMNLDDSTPGVAVTIAADPNASMAVVSCKEHCIALLGLLRAIHWEYYTSHWRVRGGGFYGDHLLFQRLYQEIEDDFDSLAEKLIYKYGERCVDPCHQMKIAHSWCAQIDSILDVHDRGHSLETMLQDQIKVCYDALDRANELSFGWDDYLMALANKHEGFMYLLKQPTI